MNQNLRIEWKHFMANDQPNILIHGSGTNGCEMRKSIPNKSSIVSSIFFGVNFHNLKPHKNDSTDGNRGRNVRGDRSP